MSLRPRMRLSYEWNQKLRLGLVNAGEHVNYILRSASDGNLEHFVLVHICILYSAVHEQQHLWFQVETLDEAIQEIEKLGKRCEKLQGDLQGIGTSSHLRIRTVFGRIRIRSIVWIRIRPNNFIK